MQGDDEFGGDDPMAEEAEESESEAMDRSEAREVADRILAQRDHSRSELLEKLTEREVPIEVAEEVCRDLRDEGVLDDRRFAIHQARLLRDRQWGPNQIRRKLRRHGVEDADCDEALSEVGDESTWLRHCYERFASKFGGPAGEMSDREKQKAFRHLTHRGYAGWTARRIVLDGYEPEHE